MIDVSHTVVTKSDQLNADDLVSGPMMIQVESVQTVDDPQQPLSVYYVGCNGRPYKPCLTVRKILVALWGKDAEQWYGRWINLYLDPTVKWAGKEVGGIRVNGMSHIKNSATLSLSVRRGAKQQFRIDEIPLQQQ